MKRIISVIVTVCLMFGITGCDWIDTLKEDFKEEFQPAENTAIEDARPVVSNSISVGIFNFDTFNPLLTKSGTVRECMEFVYEPLFELNEKQQPVPILAESFTVSADGRTIDITLKNNIQWQDGSNFNAYDAVYTMKQIRSGITTYTDVFANVADCRAAGDHVLRIVLNYAVPNFVSLLTFPVIKNKTSMQIDPNYIPMGTGPFQYETQISTGKLSFRAFEQFHNGRAKIDNLYVYTVPNLQKYESMFEANEIDVISDETIDLSEYTPRGNAKSSEYLTNKMTFVGYNIRSSILTGSETRVGLTDLIDKDMIVNSIIYSRGVACDVPINPASIFYYDTNTKFKADEVNASAHLGNDGWGIDEGGRYVRDVNGDEQVLKCEILTNSDSAEKVSIANAIADDFDHFGIPTTVNALPYGEYMAKIYAQDYDIMIGEIEIGANLDLTPLVGSAGNYFSYQNTALDTLIGQMGMTGDEEQLKELFKQYGDMIVKDMPFTPLFFRKGNILSGSKIKSQIIPSISKMYRSVETWSVTE